MLFGSGVCFGVALMMVISNIFEKDNRISQYIPPFMTVLLGTVLLLLNNLH